MRQRFTRAAGVSFLSIGLQTSEFRGIEIDNPSGSWLTIPSLETSVPPYTLGWSMDSAIALSSIDILAGDGPAGQVGTTQGDPVVVYLSSTPVGSSVGSPDPGAPFIEKFTPIITYFTGIEIRTSLPQLLNVFPPTVGRRIRLLTFDVRYALGFIAFDSGGFSAVDIDVQATTAGTLFVAHLDGPFAPRDTILLGDGTDLPTGDGLDLQITNIGGWKNEGVQMVARYQVI